MRMSRRVVLVAAAGGVAVALPFVTYATSPVVTLSPADISVLGAVALVACIWLAAILVAFVRQPDGALWKLMLAYMFIRDTPALTAVPGALVWTVGWTLVYARWGILVHVLLAFPSGHLHSRLDRMVVGVTYAASVGVRLVIQLMWDPHFVPPCPTCQNVFLIWPNNYLYDLIGRSANLTVPFIGLVVLYATYRHWAEAGPAARRALLPVVATVCLAYGWLSIYFVGQTLGYGTQLDAVGPFFIPLEAIAPAGLLFGILRTRLGRGRVAELMVELGRGIPAGGLRDALARGLGDPTLQLGFAGAAAGGYIDSRGQPMQVTIGSSSRAVARIERDGEPIAVIVHDPVIDDEDPGLVEAVATAARLAIENERLSAQVREQLEDVRASRARIVEAADVERRRVERDLHDGAQQRLVALAMRLQLARERGEGAASLLDEATTELETAVREVRDLARGMHPPILDEAGLGAAVEALAERSPVAVHLEATQDRFAPHLEAAAYFVVSEALTNIVRHAYASHATVTVVHEGGCLTIRVADDGRGNADPSRGSGLRGLADRIAAFGGRLTVTSPAGHGTVVTAELPLGGETEDA